MMITNLNDKQRTGSLLNFRQTLVLDAGGKVNDCLCNDLGKDILGKEDGTDQTESPSVLLYLGTEIALDLF